jgi:hypothetical protein
MSMPQAQADRERQRRLAIESQEESLERRLVGDGGRVQSLSRSTEGSDDLSSGDDSTVEVSSTQLLSCLVRCHAIFA